jgi:hypothetical protein
MDHVLHRNFYEFIKGRERHKRAKKSKKKKGGQKYNFLPSLPEVNKKTGEPDPAACL